MAEQILTVNTFFGGISQAEKIGLEGAFGAGSEFLDFNKDPNQLTIQLAGSKVSGSVVVDLVKWLVDASPHDTNRYGYGDTGKIYRETSGGTWSVLRTVSNAGGQGMAVSADYLYYTQDTQIGRYGPLSGSPSFTDNWQTSLNDTSSVDFAPILPFKEGIAVGHGNYLGWWDGAVWDADRLVLPAGFYIRALTQVQEFIVIGAWRGGSGVNDSETGFVFLWDGSATTFNYFFPTDGAPNALGNTRNRLVSVLGSRGQIYTDMEPFNLVNSVPGLAAGKSIEVYPGAITTWKGQTYIGMGGSTDDASVKQGIYSYGARSTLFPEVLNYPHEISTGTQAGTGMKIGALLGVGNSLYWSWKDGSSYGVDKVGSSSNFAATATYVSLVHDDGRAGHDKMPKALLVTHKPLATGESIQLGSKMDREASFTLDTANSTVGSQSTRYAIPADRYHEAEFEVILAGPGTSAPTVTSIDYLFDDLREERAV